MNYYPTLEWFPEYFFGYPLPLPVHDGLVAVDHGGRLWPRPAIVPRGLPQAWSFRQAWKAVFVTEFPVGLTIALLLALIIEPFFESYCLVEKPKHAELVQLV